MRLRGHFIGALTLAFIAIACASVDAKGTDGAADEHAHHHAAQHYTGTLAASQTVQRAFDVYRGNKMDHSPATLIRSAPGASWTRLEGFATADQLLAELSDLSQLHAAR
jgi:cytochrome oxidase Cu insertion factor (SCO1/SenC/PrrC family)